jgi:hypothetical protein
MFSRVFSNSIITKDGERMLLPGVLGGVTKAIANHLVHEPGGQEICASLACHRTEFDHIHSNDSGTLTNLMEEVE